MADIFLSQELRLVLFACAVLCTDLTVRRQKMLWAIPASVCTICVCLLGLAAGRSLEQLLIAVLVPTAILLLSQTDKEGGSNA